MTKQEAYEAILPLIRKWVGSRYPLLMWRSDASLLDCLQFVRMRIWELWEKYDPARASRRTWVTFKSTKLVLDYHRKIHGRPGGKISGKPGMPRADCPQPLPVADLLPDPSPPPHREVDQRLDVAYWVGLLLAELRQMLPPRFWRTVVEYYLHEKTMRQVGEEEGVTESAIYQRFAARIWPAFETLRRQHFANNPELQSEMSELLSP